MNAPDSTEFEHALARMMTAHAALMRNERDDAAWHEWSAAVEAVKALHRPLEERAAKRKVRP